ncbi:MAG: hypothetical protein A2161_20355 [Candidatus Schekmanbacteria bacterium RBG_13_48_7]|uniref:Uncharacterized protein n=1 Tax=Candidatus Schekmanbacteria bacterium RBG_13_48_7 TaxID=1817878 RepID=A0A1F7RIJ5_9BACT|nr:MAG: hypothetical protein A2161_20355 [Candidatus Schekmanbacteria bacterium RBG_13_48_7]
MALSLDTILDIINNLSELRRPFRTNGFLFFNPGLKAAGLYDFALSGQGLERMGCDLHFTFFVTEVL